MPRPFYFLPYLFPVLAVVGLLRGGAWAWAVPLTAFGLVPLVERFLPRVTDNRRAERHGRLEDLPLWLAPPTMAAILVALLVAAARGRLVGLDLAGATVSVGICLGAVGINVAHELGHRRERLPRLAARLLLVLPLYVHFLVEHNRGHHRFVATPLDPASARRGETLYRFWPRTLWGSFRHAWRLQADRMARLGRPWWHPGNELVPGTLAQLVLLAAVATWGGPLALAVHLGAAAVAVLLLETVNYVEHYGLQRRRTDRGTWERVKPCHSWNSDLPLGRLLLFELPRHADHHAHAARPYGRLRHLEEAPTLPLGYPAMILLALLPPLYFRVMDPLLDREAARRAA